MDWFNGLGTELGTASLLAIATLYALARRYIKQHEEMWREYCYQKRKEESLSVTLDKARAKAGSK